MGMKGRLGGLGIKIANIAAIIIVILTVVSGSMIYHTAQEAAERAISNVSIDTAETIVSHINPETYKQFLQNQKKNKVYWELRQQLNDFRVKTGALYVYTLGVTDTKEIEILIIGESAKTASTIGETTNATTYKSIEPVLKGETASTEIVNDPKYGEFLSAFAPIEDKTGKVIGILGVDINAEKVGSITDKVVLESLPTFLVTTIIFMVIAVIILYVFIMNALKPLNIVKYTAEHVAEGDLRGANKYIAGLPVKRRDEIGQLSQSFHHMVYQLKEIIQKVTFTSEHIAASSEQLYASAEQSTHMNQQIEQAIEEVATGSSKQLNASEEGFQAIEEMSLEVQQIAKSASFVSDISMGALKEAQQGKEAINKVLSQMSSINHSVEGTAKVVERLGEHSKEIVQILDVITNIADQTNLLSLNAAVEAARAGEHGKGFAVVSNEVRKLADQSRQSIDKIAGLIRGIQEDTQEAIMAMETGEEEVRSGLTVVEEADRSFQRILENIEYVVKQIQDVSASSKEVSARSKQVTGLIEEISKVAKSATVNSEHVVFITKDQFVSMNEISSSSESLAHIAQELQKAIHRFKL
ncbi:methyl-accepting chemotaxis protein [Bacillus sp. PK3_68]|uniref:methyl-accepting chemotaxis protein n=1 Tax=Bacillus sp. PK3_68 TaxID=2027408 RepID=UPI000E71C710|nr:methyl-accepting chemotaxis protein [Bacillus sp. PK3_68]RJS59342.1 hypothetical protein CJ483_04040 [Bacillus sp. PK3_68]